MNRLLDAYRQVLRKAPTSRLALLYACALLALVTDVASAAGVSLAWNNCLGGGGVTNRTFACNTNSGSRSLYVSFVPPADITRIVGIEAVIDIEAGASTLPDWWPSRPGAVAAAR